MCLALEREMSRLLTLVLPIDWRILGLDRLLLFSQIVISNIFLALRHDCQIWTHSFRPKPAGFDPYITTSALHPAPLARILKEPGLQFSEFMGVPKLVVC